MEKEKIVYANLYWIPYEGKKENTPFYCKESDLHSAESILNQIIEQKANILLERKKEEFIKNALFNWFQKLQK